MFSPQNRRLSVLVIAASALVIGTIVVLAVLELSGSGDHTGAQVRIIGFSSILLTNLAVLIKTEAHERRASIGRHAIRNDMAAVAATAQEARLDVAETAKALAGKVDVIERQTNGDLDDRIRATVEAAVKAGNEAVIGRLDAFSRRLSKLEDRRP